jgi:hypothetical protein
MLVYLASIESLSYDISRYKNETAITKKLDFIFYSYFLEVANKKCQNLLPQKKVYESFQNL